jgi:hypothetical protein
VSYGTITATLLVSALLVDGCGGGSLIMTRSTTSTRTPAAPAAGYLAELSAAQGRLAAAERQIPTAPRTPAALSKSIGLLAIAIGRLRSDLRSIHPPKAVAAAHARLVGIADRYAAELVTAAQDAARPDRTARAASELESSTGVASSTFDATVGQIEVVLGR